MLQRTADANPGPYNLPMILKTFSYLMIGALVSGLIMTVVGSLDVVAGL